MAVKKTQKILEELRLLEDSSKATANIEAKDKEKIKAYWANKKIQKQLLKDISQEEYHDGIFCMFSIFYQEDKEAAKALVEKLGKDFSRPQGLIKELFSTEDSTFEELNSSEISYHVVYFAQHFELSDEEINEVIEHNTDLLPALTSAAKSLGNRFKKFILQSTFIQNIFAFLNISLPPDLTSEEIACFVNETESHHSDKGSEVVSCEKSEPSTNLQPSKSEAPNGSVDQSSVKAKEPVEDPGVGQDNSRSVQSDVEELSISTIQKIKKTADFKPSPVKVIPLVFGQENRFLDDAEESWEGSLSTNTTKPKVCVEVIPFRLPDDANSADKSTPTNPYKTLVGPQSGSFPRMTPDDFPKADDRVVDLATFFPSPAVDKSGKTEGVKEIQPPTLSNSSVMTSQIAEDSAAPVDLSKFYKSASSIKTSNDSVGVVNPIIAMIMSPDRRQSAPLKAVDEEDSSTSASESKSSIEVFSSTLVDDQNPKASLVEMSKQDTPSKLKPLPSDIPELGSVHELGTNKPTPLSGVTETASPLLTQPFLSSTPEPSLQRSASFNLLKSLHSKESGAVTPKGNDSFSRFIQSDTGFADSFSPVLGEVFEDDLGEDSDEGVYTDESSYSDSDIPDLCAINPDKSQEIAGEVEDDQDYYLDVPNLKKINHMKSQELVDEEDEEDEVDSAPII